MTDELIAPAADYLLIADEMERGEVEFTWSYTEDRITSTGDLRVTSTSDVRIVTIVQGGPTILLTAPDSDYLLIA